MRIYPFSILRDDGGADYKCSKCESLVIHSTRKVLVSSNAHSVRSGHHGKLRRSTVPMSVETKQDGWRLLWK